MRARLTPRFHGRAGVCIGLGLFVFFSRAWLIKVWGSPLPYWDQWGTEGAHLFRPWLDGSLHWKDLFFPQNEHRIAITRVADLGILITSGSWNIWWELLLNASLHATTAALLALLFWPALEGTKRVILVAGLAVVYSAPCGWQNALWGFQSQVYFCILLSLLAVSGLLQFQVFDRRWWLGWFSAILALFTQGSGFLAALSAVIVILFFAANHAFFSNQKSGNLTQPLYSDPRRTGLGILTILGVVVLSRIFWVSAPQHASMQARSLLQFSRSFIHCLGWPWIGSDWMWIVMQAPAAWFISTSFHKRTLPAASERLALGLILLTAFHSAAVAYSRGAGLLDARPLSRYQDPLLVGVAANLFLALQVASHYRLGRPVVLMWSGILMFGVMILTTTNLSLNLPYKRLQDNASMLQVRDYLANHDATIFTRDANFTGPHPNPDAVREVLDDPRLLRVLPVEIMDPSAQPPWIIRLSPFLLIGSAAFLFWATVKSTRRSFQMTSLTHT